MVDVGEMLQVSVHVDSFDIDSGICVSSDKPVKVGLVSHSCRSCDGDEGVFACADNSTVFIKSFNSNLLTFLNEFVVSNPFWKLTKDKNRNRIALRSYFIKSIT